VHRFFPEKLFGPQKNNILLEGNSLCEKVFGYKKHSGSKEYFAR
jgi:hypothetical protein